jgi:hypothetical protein
MTIPNKWTAFWLSACVPGAGQLAIGSSTCWGWFALTALVVAAFVQAEERAEKAAWLVPLKLVAGGALCLVSAEHAKRLREVRQRERAVTQSRVRSLGGRGRQVHMVITLTVAREARELWNLASDLPRFLTIDPFHDRVTLMRSGPAVGVDLVLSHNAFGRRFFRFGRIVAWREGLGYTFSDLSGRGPRTGFPHVFTVRIAPGNSAAVSELTIRIHGRWTSRVVPVWMGRWWIWLVCREHARLLSKGL